MIFTMLFRDAHSARERRRGMRRLSYIALMNSQIRSATENCPTEATLVSEQVLSSQKKGSVRFEKSHRFSESYGFWPSIPRRVLGAPHYSFLLTIQKEENMITAIDARPTKEFTMTQIRKMFMRDSKEYLITLKRGPKELQTKLKLRRLI
jgi:hypothetical protein